MAGLNQLDEEKRPNIVSDKTAQVIWGVVLGILAVMIIIFVR